MQTKQITASNAQILKDKLLIFFFWHFYKCGYHLKINVHMTTGYTASAIHVYFQLYICLDDTQ